MFKIRCYNSTQIVGANFFNQSYKSREDITADFLRSGFKIIEDWEIYKIDTAISWLRVSKDDRQELVYAYDLPDDYDEKVEF